MVVQVAKVAATVMGMSACTPTCSLRISARLVSSDICAAAVTAAGRKRSATPLQLWTLQASYVTHAGLQICHICGLCRTSLQQLGLLLAAMHSDRCVRMPR